MARGGGAGSDVRRERGDILKCAAMTEDEFLALLTNERMTTNAAICEVAQSKERLAAREERIATLEAEVAALRTALEFYADPGIYLDGPDGFAIAFELLDDFGEVEGGRERPGKRARAALATTAGRDLAEAVRALIQAADPEQYCIFNVDGLCISFDRRGPDFCMHSPEAQKILAALAHPALAAFRRMP